jgi:PAS domain S-box-containing protein
MKLGHRRKIGNSSTRNLRMWLYILSNLSAAEEAECRSMNWGLENWRSATKMKSCLPKHAGPYGRSVSLKISGIYVLVGSLWILFSDLALEAITSDSGILTRIAVFKGTFYVAATGLMLYLLIKRQILVIERSQEALRATEEKYCELVENANSIIMRRDSQGRITFFNEFAQKFFGYSEEEILGENVVGTIVPQVDMRGHDLAEMIKNIGRDPNQYRNNQNENMRRNGERVWIAWTNKAILDSRGQVVEVLSVGNDITERKRVEEALQESEEKYRLIFENMPDLYYRADNEGRIVLISPSVEPMFGYTREEALGMPLAEKVYVDPDQRKQLLKILEETGEAKGFEVVLKRKDGSHIWVSTNSRFYKDRNGKVLGVEGIVRDVTEKKLGEIQLNQINDYLENLLENSPDAIGIADEHGKFLKWNRMATALFGHSLEEIHKVSAFDLYASENEREELLSELRRNGIVRAREVKLHRFDGTTFPVELSVSLLSDGSGKNTGSIAIARDLSEIKKANEELKTEIARRQRIEQTLRESENSYRTIFENTGAATVIIEADTIITLANAGFEKLSGFAREEMEGKRSWTEFVASTDLARMKKYHELRRIDPGSAPRRYEFHFIDRHGNSKAVLATVATIPGTPKSVASLIDITEQKKLEEELSRADKLESVGVLAGGIAHDFNNILGAIMGNISLAKLDANREDRLYGLLEEAERATVRAKDLTYQLLTFARGGAPVKKATSILAVVREAAGFALRGSNVRSRIEEAEDLWLADADVGQISQVINNLVINAKQAMPSGGVVTIALRNVLVSESSGVPLAPGHYVKISVADQGTGIPKEHLQKIFDPYFTTKQAGSGLGLAAVYSILSKHNGHIAVESELGAGATFHLYLPAAVTPLEPVEPVKCEPISGQGKVLLMDDNDMVRSMAAEMLAFMGYAVVTARDGLEAADVFRKAKEAGEPFDAVILDLTIPGGSGGVETLAKLREMDPAVKAIASSGYSNDPVMARFAEYGFQGVLAKPYEIRGLGSLLGQIVGTESCR